MLQPSHSPMFSKFTFVPEAGTLAPGDTQYIQVRHVASHALLDAFQRCMWLAAHTAGSSKTGGVPLLIAAPADRWLAF